MTESFPFHSWMPKPAGVAVLLALFVPLFFSGGTYLSNINEMAGSMGVQTEEFQFLSLCASIGMSMVFPFMVPYLRGRNVKAVYIGGYAVLALLNVVCAVSRNLPLLALCSFLIGFVRVALVLNTTFVIAPYMLGINTLDMFLHDPPTASEAYRGEHVFVLPINSPGLFPKTNHDFVRQRWHPKSCGWNRPRIRNSSPFSVGCSFRHCPISRRMQ